MNNHKQLQEIPEFYLNQDPQRFNLQVKQRKSLNIVNRWRNQYKNNLKNFQCISKFIKILNPVLMLIVTILLFAYVGLIYYNGQSNQEVYEQFLQNQNQEIIAGIYIEWLSSTCQAPYEPIFNYNFDQQIIGCDCSQTNQQNISVGKECNSFLLKQGCFTFHQRLQQNLTQLNNNGYGTSFIICVKREKNVSLKNNQTYCQQEQRTVCGKDLKYCLPINVNCPITEFGIRSFADIDEQYIDKSINLGNRQFFYFGYNENILPISEVLLIKGDKVCKLNKNIYQQVIQYENKEKFCSYFDPLYKNVYTISEEQFFQSNNLIQYKNELNYFYVNNTQNWTLQTKSYTLISDECQDQDFFNKMLTNEYEAQINRQKLNLFILITVFSSLLFSSHFSIFFKFIENWSQKMRILIVQIPLIVIYFVVALLLILNHIWIDEIIQEVAQIQKIPCILFDEANNYLKSFVEDHSFSSFQNGFRIFLIVILITFSVFEFIVMILLWFKCQKNPQNLNVTA